MTTATEAKIEITAGTARLPAALRTALKSFQGFATSVGQSLIGINSDRGADKAGAKAWGQHALGQVAGNLATRGLDLLVDQGKQIIDFERNLTRLGIAARMSQGDLASVRREIGQASNDTGIARDEILRGARAYVDIAGAEAYTADKMRLLARVAQSSQSDIGDLAQVMFQLEHAMHVNPAELENTFSGLINMSKDGAVHFAQMQAEINELAPQAARYGMVGRAGANELAALMQVARTGFGTVSEMGTGITRVFTGLTMHASKFRKYGVEVFNVGKDGTKTWRKFSDIFNDIRTNNILSKDPELLRKAFGRSEADRTIRLWMEGTAALKKFEDAGMENGVVTKDLATYVESAAGRMDVAFERTKNKIADAFTPERIDKFSHALEEIAEKIEPIAKAAGFVGDVLGGLYKGGKAIRGFFTPDDSRIYAPTFDEIADYTRRGVSEHDALRLLTGQHSRYASAKAAIAAAMKGDQTTPESDELAVRARFAVSEHPGDHTALGAEKAGAAYIEAAGLSPERVADIYKKIREKDLDSEIAAGRGRTIAPVSGPAAAKAFDDAIGSFGQGNASRAVTHLDIVAAFKDAIKTTLGPAIGRAISDAARTPVVQLDGNKVSDGIGNSSGVRRR